MDENIKDQDILLVQEGNEPLKVVAGTDGNGKLKTVPPGKEHQPDFMKIDKHSNVLENFFSNFLRQYKDPTHFGFFRSSVENVESNAHVLGEMLKQPDSEFNKEALDSVRVHPEEYAKQTASQTQQGYQPLDVERIDWAQFERIGITRESLEKSNSLDTMLNYRKSPGLVPITLKLDDMNIRTDARLSLKELPDGRIIPNIHAIQKEPQLDRPFYGNTFTLEDKQMLRETGNLGRLIDLKIPGKEDVRAFVSIDRLTNDVIALDARRVRIPDEIKGVKLSQQQKKELSEGKAIYVEGMTAKNGNSFNATLQFNADKRGVEFQFGNQHKQSQQQEQQPTQNNKPFQWLDEKGNICAPKRFGGVPLSESQKQDFREGKEIYMQGMIKDGKDKPYNAYIKFNPETGKPHYDFKRRKEQSIPANESQTQVAVNSEGKTNEATKNLKEPLQQGQVEPTPQQKQETEQQQQNKPKGMRM